MKTAECVSPKHPDKMCDRISDAILDFCLKQDPNARVAIEVMGGHGVITVTGEVTLNGILAAVDVYQIANRIGSDGENDLNVRTNIVVQSTEIANGVDTGGAGDQGIMVGYACNDNEAMIPHEQYLARELCKYIYKEFPFDGKTQITLDNNNIITDIVASFQNVDSMTLTQIVYAWLGGPQENSGAVNLHINPAGDWNQGGFDADTGLTGRKLMVDNYGPQIPVGGGAFSGKDPSKVDRSAAYMARKIAVDILKQENAEEVTVKLAYAIGVAKPVMATAQVIDKKNKRAYGIDIRELYDLTPKGIIDTLDLRKPQYQKTAKWGHFGNDFIWDK